MSNYTQLVLYGPKDSLTNGDPNKLIRGVQIDAELAAVASAIATKLDTPVSNLPVTGTANNYGVGVAGSATTGQSFGVSIQAGTNSSDAALTVNNKAGSNLFQIKGDGSMTANGASVTMAGGSWSATASGGTTGTFTINWARYGSVVHLWPSTSITGTTGASGINFRVVLSGVPGTIFVTTGGNLYIAPIDLGGASNAMIFEQRNTGNMEFGFENTPGTSGNQYTWRVGQIISYALT